VRVGGVRVFRPKIGKREDFEKGGCRFSRKSDEYTILSELARRTQRVEVNRAYKRKAEKVRLVDLGESDGSKPGGVTDWIAKSKEKDVQGHEEKYPGWLIPKFSDIKKGSRLTDERLKKLIVGGDLTLQERDLFEEMLYN
jgi:hypothetical protein